MYYEVHKLSLEINPDNLGQIWIFIISKSNILLHCAKTFLSFRAYLLRNCILGLNPEPFFISLYTGSNTAALIKKGGFIFVISSQENTVQYTLHCRVRTSSMPMLGRQECRLAIVEKQADSGRSDRLDSHLFFAQSLIHLFF